jgi:hypothetical protein
MRANNAIVTLNLGGQISVGCYMPSGPAKRTHIIFDVAGYFVAEPVNPMITTSDTDTMFLLQTQTPTKIAQINLLKS